MNCNPLRMIRFSKESRTYGGILSDLISLSVEAAHKRALPVNSYPKSIPLCAIVGVQFPPPPSVEKLSSTLARKSYKNVCGIIKIYSLESLADAATAAERNCIRNVYVFWLTINRSVLPRTSSDGRTFSFCAQRETDCR